MSSSYPVATPDLDKITDELEREATVGIIHNCQHFYVFVEIPLILVSVGQTPRKLFNAPHPQRLNHGHASLPIGTLYGVEEDPDLLVQDIRCFKGIQVRMFDASQLDFQIKFRSGAHHSCPRTCLRCHRGENAAMPRGCVMCTPASTRAS